MHGDKLNNIIDVKDLVEELEILKKKLSFYKTFFDNTSEALFIVEPETWTVVETNDVSSILLGIPKEAIIGSIIPQFKRIFKLLKKSNSPVILSEMSLDSADNTSLMVEITARFINYDGKQLIQATARDVSEQHQLTDKLVQADKLVLLGQLTASVAHEIRNPLAAVNLNLQIIQRKIPTESPEINFVKTALQGVERINRIVEVTLNFSRSSSPDIQFVNFNKLIPATMELFTSAIKRKKIDFILNLEEELPTVYADYKQMQQVLINLIKNAADAINKQGLITIKTYSYKTSEKKDDYSVVVAISDTGSGIAPEDLPKIFNPFFTRKEEGTGLGLPITQRILHQYRGSIDVESVLGQGTTFYIKLPAKKNE